MAFRVIFFGYSVNEVLNAFKTLLTGKFIREFVKAISSSTEKS